MLRIAVFPQLFGKYVLEREIASGGMARVYLATLRGAVGFEKRLVVKQIRPELASDQAFVRRFVVEAKTTVDLSHPNIVPVYELGVEQGVYYIAMELCAGVTLAEILASAGPLSPAEGAYLGVEICRALDYAHRRAGIVHRDVTPRNVLVDEEGAVRLIDFGIAAPVAADGRALSEIFGSPGHMPPEQLGGKSLSPATDVFAVAALLVEAWTGKAVFRRATAKASEQALTEPVPPLDERVPELASLSDLIGRSLALDATLRPAHAELLSRPLREFLRPFDVGDVARRLGQRVRRTTRRSRRPAPSAGLASTTGNGNAPAIPDSNPAASSDRISSVGSEPTYTFAAREEVAVWTRQFQSTGSESPSSVPPAYTPPSTPNAAVPPAVASSSSARRNETGPSTRKLPSIPPSQPPPPDSPEAPSEPLAAAAPVTAEAADRASDGSEPVSVERAAASVRVDATGGSRWRLPALAAAGVAALTLAFALARSDGPRPMLAKPKEPESSPALAASTRLPADGPGLPAEAPSQRRAEVEPSALAPARPEPTPRESQPRTASSAKPPRAARSDAPASPSSETRAPAASAEAVTAPVASGVLRLTADPPAAVNLQGPAGSRALMTPVSELEVPAGAYILTFRNETFGQPVVARVTLAPDSERSVHVDFREVEPRVTIR